MNPFRRLVRDRRGNFAVFSALAAVPLVFAAGAGVDLSRSLAARSSLQNAIDAAVLAVVKDSGFVQFEGERIAREMIEANYDGVYEAMTVRFTESGAEVSAETRVDATLTRLLGFATLDATVSGTAEYPPTRYEIALVLDTTGSMAGPKLEAMKSAATQMIEKLTASEHLRRRVSFALVPFANFVNVGADKANAGWIDGQGLVQVPYSVVPAGVSRLEIFQNFGQSWKGCVETRVEAAGETLSVDDTTPAAARPRTLFVPALAPDEPGLVGGRRLYPNDYSADGLSGLGVTLDARGRPSYQRGLRVGAPYRFFGGEQDPQGPNQGCTSQPVRALTQDFAGLDRDIRSLRASGATNITEGVAWGNRVLSPGEPFAEGLPYEADVQKIMVVLTDGDNTMTRLDNHLQSTHSAMGYVVDGRWNDSYKSDPASRTSLCLSILGIDLLGESDDDDDGGLISLTCQTRTPGRATGPRPSAAEITAAMNRQTSAACEIAKESAVEVYTVRLEIDSASSSDLLSRCASTETHYYDAPEASQLGAIFDDIADRIMTLKITS